MKHLGLLALALCVVACGTPATPTPDPTATPEPTLAPTHPPTSTPTTTPLASPTPTVTAEPTGTAPVTLGPVVDHGNGTYSAFVLLNPLDFASNPVRLTVTP